MKSRYPLSNLNDISGLQIALVGPKSGGKTSLLKHILRHGVPLPPPSSPTSSPSTPSLREALQRIFRPVTRLLSHLPIAKSCASYHKTLSCPDGATITLWDSTGTTGLPAIAQAAESVDVILFVTRLDDGRAARCDRIILHDLLNLFGEAALGKLVFVLSRGMSLPPADLHWEEWVHGRVELLHTYVCDVFPAVVVSGSVVEMDARTREMQRYEEELPDAPEGLMAVCKAIVNDDDTDEGSVSNVPSNFVDLLFDAAVDRTDTREFEDVTCPEAVVVEMGEGGDVLEDGTEWFPRLVEVIGEIARRTKELERKERERIMKEREENVGTEEEHGVFQKAQQVVAHLKRDSRMLLVGELVILVMVLCLGGIVENIGKRRQRRKRKESIDEDDDILLSISDEEYEQLTRPDPGSGGMVVLEGAGEEDEDDKELGEDEADFFGEVRSNK